MSIQINPKALRKGWKRYIIMQKNRRVASIREDGTCTVYFPSFMPYNLWFEENKDIDTRVNNLNNFYYWCASRVLTLDRKYAKEIMSAIGAKQAVTDKDRAMISLSYHCLCLTDVYWVRTDKEKLNFEDINLYSHSLSGAFADICLAGRGLTVQNSELLAARDAAGDIATQGVAPKAWLREKDAFVLLKDGDERDVEAELLASKIADCFNMDHVRYEPGEFEGKLVSKSKLITDTEHSIVPMEYIDIYCQNHGLDRQSFILKKDGYSFYMMNLFDYLVGNTDRHWGNWGLWIDNRTNKLGKLHPLMDFNKAFLSYDTIDGTICQTIPGKLTQRQAAMEAVKAVGLNMTADVDPEWFSNEQWRGMFFARLALLQESAAE